MLNGYQHDGGCEATRADCHNARAIGGVLLPAGVKMLDRLVVVSTGGLDSVYRLRACSLGAGHSSRPADTPFSYHQTMTTDAYLYLVRPGDPGFSNETVGCFSIRGIEFSGQTIDSQKCLDIGVETHPPLQPVVAKNGDKEVPVAFTWLQLRAEVWTRSTPRHRVGRVHIDQKGMLPNPASWLWEVLPRDVEVIEETRSNQPNAPIYLQIEITGLARMIDPATGLLFDIVPLRGSNPQHTMELSHWERLMQHMEYKLPPTQAALAGLSSLQHPSWAEATRRLENARSHHRAGEDYDALRECLSTLESLVSLPYAANAWKDRLKALPDQKATGVAELFSGMAMYCNKVGHHRSRDERNATDDLLQMPLDHWEADLSIGAAQFVTAYALRLRMSGLLAEKSAPSSDTYEGSQS